LLPPDVVAVDEEADELEEASRSDFYYQWREFKKLYSSYLNVILISIYAEVELQGPRLGKQ
jgi:hypothetical protein